MKKIWISSVLCVVLVVMAGCTSSKTAVKQTTPQASTTQSSTTTATGDLTLAQLKKYNGQNGNPAYVAIDGTIYDVTNVKGWSNGQHKGGASAGKDLSSIIDSSPHGRSVLANLTVIGKLK